MDSPDQLLTSPSAIKLYAILVVMGIIGFVVYVVLVKKNMIGGKDG